MCRRIDRVGSLGYPVRVMMDLRIMDQDHLIIPVDRHAIPRIVKMPNTSCSGLVDGQ